MSELPRTVVISSERLGSVETALPFAELPNVADFDVAIVDGLAISRVIREAQRDSEALSPELFTSWNAWLRSLREKLRKILKSDGTVYALVDEGATAVAMRTIDSMDGPVELPIFVQSNDWLPLPIDLLSESGSTVSVIDDSLGRYMRKVAKWNFHVAIDEDPRHDSSDELQEEHHGWDIEIGLEPVAMSRQQLPIAAAVYYSLKSRTRGVASRGWSSGKMYILPAPTECSISDGIRILLEDMCSVSPIPEEPDWVAAVVIPGATDIGAEIAEKKRAMKNIEAELTPLVDESRRREDFRAVLFSTGVEPLQRTIRELFEEIGLATTDSLVSDEFMLEVDGDQILIEVKGNEKSAKLTDLRQLIDYQLEHEQEHAAIDSALVVTAWRLLPLKERGGSDTPIFPDNVQKRARDNGIALVDATELWDVLNRHWAGDAVGETIFNLIKDGRGYVSLLP